MSEQERITELETLNERLAQQIVGFSDRVQESIRPALAKAWDEGYKAGKTHAELQMWGDPNTPKPPNPHKSEVLK